MSVYESKRKQVNEYAGNFISGLQTTFIYSKLVGMMMTKFGVTRRICEDILQGYELANLCEIDKKNDSIKMIGINTPEKILSQAELERQLDEVKEGGAI